MKQILQDIKNGNTQLAKVPVPMRKKGHLLIRSRQSLISAGTERMLIYFGRAGYLEKAKQQPEKVKMVLDKIRTDGLIPTIEAVQSKLNQLLPLGYCNVGVVEAFDGSGFMEGERVVSNGPHAEFVSVPENLCAKIPETVTDESAAFTVLGAIALQGIRLAGPELGEIFVVTGLGLIGQLAVQLLIANGCSVIGVDIDTEKCSLAEKLGAKIVDLSKGEDPVAFAMQVSNNKGIDGVLITASTKSSEPIHQAAQMCRKKGRIVLVGVTGLELNRVDFYEKELSFQVSCSYGPGRYDPEYEEKGNDYPLGYVRWTAQRNFTAVLGLMAQGKMDIEPLISHRFPIEEAEKAYEMIGGTRASYLGVLLEYQPGSLGMQSIPLCDSVYAGSEGAIAVAAVIGAGNYTGQVFLPALRKTGIRLKHIVSSRGVNGTHFGQKFGFEQSTTDSGMVFKDNEINVIFITTRHDSHCKLVKESLRAEKHVFVEKPLCLTLEELDEIKGQYLGMKNPPLLMVGFNRRFAPHVVKIKKLISQTRAPKSFIMTVNAGSIPSDHWTQDKNIGGGRIIGEACHFIDLLRFLAGSKILTSSIEKLNSGLDDTVCIHLSFADGSIGSIHYFSNGNKSFAKERLEVFCDGKILQLDNFKTLKGFGWPRFTRMKLWRQDKGHWGGIHAFIDAVNQGKGKLPIPFEEIVEVTQISIELAI